MIDATFIQKILDISDVEVKDVDGRKFASRPMSLIKKAEIATLNVSHLSGIVDYVKNAIDYKSKDEIFIHIAGYSRVELLTYADSLYLDRNVLVAAIVDDTSQKIFGNFKDQEMFLLDLNTRFVRTENIELLIEIVSNVRSEDVRIDEDDGISQNVTTRSGVARLANVKLPSQVVLQPYRTFSEIVQPEDHFVFRARKGSKEGTLPTFGLFESGSKRWEIDAIESIKKYFQKNLPEMKIVG
jgi:hypothetical protein